MTCPLRNFHASNTSRSLPSLRWSVGPLAMCQAMLGQLRCPREAQALRTGDKADAEMNTYSHPRDRGRLVYLGALFRERF
jgi:hypothetical protein